LVAEHFNVPIALISLVDENEVFFKAAVGMEEPKRTSRGISLCSLAVLSDDPTVIEAPLTDPCLLANPLVHGAFGLRFYAAAPLITPGGQRIGAICVVDKNERRFSQRDQKQLQRFSKVIMHEMELRLAVRQREEELKAEVERRERLVTKAVIQAQERERTRLDWSCTTIFRKCLRLLSCTTKLPWMVM
jgi:GAF domain-containing protein